MKLLLSYKQAFTITTNQGLFGARSQKPTTLLCVHIPKAGELLQEATNQCRIDPARYVTALGRDEVHGFRTTPLKEYPPAFCKFISQLFQHTWHNILPTTSDAVVMHKQLERFYTCISSSTEMGKDYAGATNATDTQYEDLELTHAKEEPLTPTEDARSEAELPVPTWPHVPQLTRGGEKAHATTKGQCG